jgi:hypothetical protein
MDIPWGGIWGHVSLESRADAWLDELQVQTNVADATCTVGATLHGQADMTDHVRLDVFDSSGQSVAQSTSKIDEKILASRSVAVTTGVPNAKLWTPETPTLYRARLTLLKGDKVVDSVESRFGIRQITINGPHLLLNGKRIMLCGYGDDHIYPEQMAMPCDKELHLARLRTIKSYGFNHVRHHSTIMPPEYYDACDELGILCTAEFAIPYDGFMPGTGAVWKSNVAPGTSPAAATDTYRREWMAAIKRHRNHPSILCWVMGNEIWDGIPLRTDFARIAKESDPSRLFVDSDGLWGFNFVGPNTNILESKKDRDTLPLYFLLFNCFSNPLDNPTKFMTAKPPKPIVSHEAGNYVTFSRPDLVDQFKHNMKPFWLTAGRDKLKTLGLLSEADQWAEKSERLYALLHKHNLEALRRNPNLSGYHWWLFQDYWTSSNGIVDHYFRPKSITKEDVLRFNRSVVVLQDGLDRTYRSGAHLKVKLLVSNFSPEAISGKLLWEVKAGDQVIATNQAAATVPQGDLSDMTQIDVALPDVASPRSLTITAKLIANETTFTNDWTTWLYPATIRPQELPVPVFADDAQIKQLKPWDVKPIPTGELADRAVYVVSWPCDPRVVAALQRGACVVCLDGGQQILKSYRVTFRTSWWKAGGTPQENHAGTFVYDHPVTRAIAPDRWCDDGWFHLIEGANKFVLEGKPARPNVIVRALASMAMLEDDALLFEVSIGKGSLIVSGLNHRKAQGRPENEWLLARLLEHAGTMPKTTAQWPVSSVVTPASAAR